MGKDVVALFLMALVAVGGGIMFWSFLNLFIEKKWIKTVLVTLMEISLIYMYTKRW
jgi:hypothetical protein